MKTIFLISATLVMSISTFAQNFKPTSDFHLALQSSLTEDNQVLQSASLQTNDSKLEEVTFFPVVNGSKVSEIEITTLNNPFLSGVKRVIKVNVHYIEFCTYTISNYILETDKGGYISLPALTNEDCGDEMTFLEYTFPSQKFGKENQIITSQITKSANTIINASQEDSFIWNDDNYGTSGTLYDNF